MNVEPQFTCPRCGPNVKQSIAHAAGIVLIVVCHGCRDVIHPPPETSP